MVYVRVDFTSMPNAEDYDEGSDTLTLSVAPSTCEDYIEERMKIVGWCIVCKFPQHEFLLQMVVKIGLREYDEKRVASLPQVPNLGGA